MGGRCLLGRGWRRGRSDDFVVWTGGGRDEDGKGDVTGVIGVIGEGGGIQGVWRAGNLGLSDIWWFRCM